jgi:hypothetical protein
MKPKLLIICPLLVLSALLSTVRAQTNADNPKLLAELVDLSRKIYEAGLAGDRAFLDRHIAPDFAEADDSGEFRNTYQSVLYGVSSGEKFTHEITEAHVRERGDVAVLSYRWVFRFQREEEEGIQKYVHVLGVTDVFHRQGGVWQLFATHRDFSGEDFPATVGRAQKPTGDRLEKITKFLSGGEKVAFTGEFVPIPVEIVRKLEHSLFLHHFYIVRMRRSFDISSKNENWLVAVDARSNEVVGTLVDYAIDDPPVSFKRILTGYPVSDLTSALKRVKILGDLILSLWPDDVRSFCGRVGAVRFDKVISAELIYDDIPSYLLHVEINKDRFGPLSITRLIK